MVSGPKKVIIFDFDGTLVDSMSGFGEIASQVMDHHFACGLDWAREQYRKTSGLPFPFQIERIFPGDPRNQPTVADFNDQKRTSYASRPFYADVEPTLAWLKENNFLAAISSNNDADLVKNKLGPMENHFEMVLGFRPGFLKGEDHFTWIFHKLSVSASEALFVGDSLHDARMARDSNIDFVAKTGTLTEQEFKEQGIAVSVIPSLSFLPQVLGKPPHPILKDGCGGKLSLQPGLADADSADADYSPGGRARLAARK